MKDNKFDLVFAESMPQQLKNSILQQAQEVLAQNRKRELLKKFAYIFGGLATASVVGINISRNFPKATGIDPQLAELSHFLKTDDGLIMADLNEDDLDLLAQLDQFEDLMENVSEDELNYILKDDV
jgi:hypothetical protein